MKKMLGALVGVLQWLVQRLIRPLTVALVGEINWAPPRWLRFLADLARSASQHLHAALAQARERNPRRFWTLAATLAVCLAGSVAAWNWYRHLPKPHKLGVTGTWPQPTRLEKDAKPDPLVIRFSGSAALLGQVGKEVKSGIAVAPPLEGTWDWRSDSSLVFTPKADWEVGRKYTIHFDRRLFPSHVLLSSYTYDFQSPAFASSIAEAQFYDDPTNPKVKKVVATVRFTHPVDKTDFEKRIALRMRIEPVKSFDSPAAKAFGFKVAYDELGGKAFIHSDSFPIPSDEAEMLLIIDKGAHAARGGPGTREKIERTVHIPGIESYFRITSVSAGEVENEHEEVDRVGTVSATAQMRQSDLDKYLSVVLLPKDKPAVGDQPVRESYRWSDPLEVVPEVLKLTTPVKVEWLAPEHEWSPLQSFKFAAEADRDLFVTVRQGLTSFGDYPLKKDFSTILHAEPLQRTVRIVSQGALLSLTGERKISIRTRSVDAIELEVSRILPGSLSNLVSQSAGTFANPQFGETSGADRYGYRPPRDFGLDNLSEIFSEVRTFSPDPSGRNHYTELDFSSLLANGATPRGLFSLTVQVWDPKKKEPAPQGPVDRRLVLLTDLGLLVKDSADGSHDAFVQSIRTGEPVAEASVSVLGKNGLAILSAKTDANGHVTFPTLKDFKREKTPTVYTVEKDGDLSFLPIDRSDRRLNFSRFDTGGVYSTPNSDSLQAYLFSDRGIYRPGEQIHLGMIVRTIDWTALPDGLPLELVVNDPRGIEIHRQVVKFSTVGFEEFSTATQEDSPTGAYQFALYIKRDKERRTLLGSTSVRVEEFQPDRMIIKAELSAAPSEGWVAPGALGAKVLLRNLFGTPAAGRTVKGSFKLWPSVTAFPKYAAYRFHDPYETKHSYEEQLGEVTTDADGRASFDMKLERFERGIYHLRFVAEGFEPEGGRSVVADVSALVSPAPFLVAYKPDGDLHYMKKDSERSIHVVAIDAKAEPVAAADLESDLVEIRYVSVLTKQENGTFAYQSVKKETSREKKPLTIPAGGFTLKLPTAEPGSFAFVVRDSKGVELNRVSFDVVGQANVSRSLEREAELKIKLGSSEVKPGDEVEVEIEAPYVGSGLITIERDRVYNARWFNTTTTGSVQKIRVPEELEGNGYVTVTFLRSLDSKEIFMSPLSYGAVPFAVSRARHSEALTLHVPELVRPGDKLKVDYQTAEPAKLLLVAVDEGILQVARYNTPDPLGHFFRKRALEVTTSQILDLVLPEIRLLNEASAPGGDEEGRLARHLNPFKRKNQRPVAFWSGIVDSDGKPGSVEVAIPDYFNGTVRVMAVAANASAIGVAEAKTVSQGYFVLQPQAPYFAAPGDEFEVTSLVANNTDASGGEARVKVGLETSSDLEVVGEREQELSIPKGGDKTVSFRVRARPEPGAAHLTMNVSGEAQARELLLRDEHPAGGALRDDRPVGIRAARAHPRREGRSRARAEDVRGAPQDRGLRLLRASRTRDRPRPLSPRISLRLHRAARQPGIPRRHPRGAAGIRARRGARREELHARLGHARRTTERGRSVRDLGLGIERFELPLGLRHALPARGPRARPRRSRLARRAGVRISERVRVVAGDDAARAARAGLRALPAGAAAESWSPTNWRRFARLSTRRRPRSGRTISRGSTWRRPTSSSRWTSRRRRSSPALPSRRRSNRNTTPTTTIWSIARSTSISSPSTSPTTCRASPGARSARSPTRSSAGRATRSRPPTRSSASTPTRARSKLGLRPSFRSRRSSPTRRRSRCASTTRSSLARTCPPRRSRFTSRARARRRSSTSSPKPGSISSRRRARSRTGSRSIAS